MAVITNFLDIVTLAEAKTYLRLDTDMTESDAEITNMINSAFEYIQKETNYIFVPQDKDYLFRSYDCNAVNVYDFPINAVVTPADVDDYIATEKTLYTRYQNVKSGNTKMVLSVGYEDTADVPAIFKQAVLEIVKNWYYLSDENTGAKNYLSNAALVMLAPYKRFIM